MIAATLQVAALLPDASWGHTAEAPMLEFDVYENPFRDQLVTHPFRINKGYMDVPTAPGLGIEADEEVLKRYAKR